MKKIFYPLMAVFFIAYGCSSDDDNSGSDVTPADVSGTMVAGPGDWRITNFTEDGENHTSYFTGYDFVFDTSNTVTADNGTNTYSGAWAVTEDTSNDDSSSDVDLNILFASPDDFTELSEDWEVVNITSVKVVLKHVSGGNGGTDFLTFERN